MARSGKRSEPAWATEALLRRLAAKQETPFYLFNQKEIRANFRSVETAFGNWQGAEAPRILYSVKNNPLLGILRTIAAEGAWFETSTMGEIEALRKIGVAPSRCVYTGFWKPESDIAQCLRWRVSLLTVDSVHDVQAIIRVAKKQKVRPRLLLRINTGVTARGTRFHAAGPGSRFGARIHSSGTRRDPSEDSADAILDAIARSSAIELVGLHGHVGSQVTRISDFERHAAKMAEFARRAFLIHGLKLSIMDIGGGFPAKYGSKSVPPLAKIAKRMMAALRSGGFRGKLLVEPGRYITANAGLLATKVVKVKAGPHGARIAILDASAYNVLLDSLIAGWHYQSRILGHDNPPEPVLMAGFTNDTLDVFGSHESMKAARGARPIRLGDIVVFEGVGAYSVCFNMNYGLEPSPAAYLLRSNGGIRLIRSRETVSDVLRRF